MKKSIFLFILFFIFCFRSEAQTIEYHDEASFLAGLGGATISVENYNNNVGGSYTNNIVFDDFTASSTVDELAISGSCPSEGTGALSHLANVQNSLNKFIITFNEPQSFFGTYINSAGNTQPVTITFMTEDGSTYTAVMSMGGDPICTKRFFGIDTDMLFISVEIERSISNDTYYLDQTYYGINPFQIPTLSQWGIIALGMITMIFGVVMIRQRKTIFA